MQEENTLCVWSTMEAMNQSPQVSRDTNPGTRLPPQTLPKLSWGTRIMQVFTLAWMSEGTDIRKEAEKITKLVHQALSETSSPHNRKAATEKLIDMVQKLQKREKTASPEERKRIAETLAHAKASMMAIFITQTSSKGKEQKVEPVTHEMQIKYGTALAEGILSKATSEQEVMNLFILQATEVQNLNKELAPDIIEGIIGKIEKKYSRDFAENLRIILSLTSQGSSVDEQEQNLFILTAKQNPQLALLALDQIGKNNPAALERLRSAVQKEEWKEGKTFFQIKDLVTRFEEGRIDYEATAELKDLEEKNALGKNPEIFRDSVRQLMGAMLKYCDKERTKSPQKPTMEFVYKNWEAVSKTIILGKRGLGDEFRMMMSGQDTIAKWLWASVDIINPGVSQTFLISAPPPVVKSRLDDAIEDAQKKCQDDSQKLMVAAWFKNFLRPSETVDDLPREKANFSPPTDPQKPSENIQRLELAEEGKNATLAVCQFAQAMYESFPSRMQTLEMKEAIGKLCVAATQGFAPVTVCALGVTALIQNTAPDKIEPLALMQHGDRGEAVAHFSTDPKEGSCSVEFTFKANLLDMRTFPPSVKQTALLKNIMKVKPGEPGIQVTFEALDPSPKSSQPEVPKAPSDPK